MAQEKALTRLKTPARDDGWEAVEGHDPYLESFAQQSSPESGHDKPRGSPPDPYLVEIARTRRLLESGLDIEEQSNPQATGDSLPDSDEQPKSRQGTLRSLSLVF